jgi:hypothetical protein
LTYAPRDHERLAASLGLAGAEADRFVALARGHSVGPVASGDGVPGPAAAPLPRDLVRAFGRDGRVVGGAFPWFPEEDGTPVPPAAAIAVVHLAVELMAGAMLEALSLHGGREVATAAVRRALAQLLAAQATHPIAAGPPTSERPDRPGGSSGGSAAAGLAGLVGEHPQAADDAADQVAEGERGAHRQGGQRAGAVRQPPERLLPGHDVQHPLAR